MAGNEDLGATWYDAHVRAWNAWMLKKDLFLFGSSFRRDWPGFGGPVRYDPASVVVHT